MGEINIWGDLAELRKSRWPSSGSDGEQQYEGWVGVKEGGDDITEVTDVQSPCDGGGHSMSKGQKASVTESVE